MQWDLGLQGLSLLAVMSLAFGLTAQLLFARRTNAYLWAYAATAFFVGGLIASEVWFGWATAEELQPNIDGLSFDEALLSGFLFGVVAIIATWLLSPRGRSKQGPTSV